MRVLSFSWPPVRVRPGAPNVVLTCGYTPQTRFTEGAKSRFTHVFERKGGHVFALYRAN